MRYGLACRQAVSAGAGSDRGQSMEKEIRAGFFVGSLLEE